MDAESPPESTSPATWRVLGSIGPLFRWGPEELGAAAWARDHSGATAGHGPFAQRRLLTPESAAPPASICPVIRMRDLRTGTLRGSSRIRGRLLATLSRRRTGLHRAAPLLTANELRLQQRGHREQVYGPRAIARRPKRCAPCYALCTPTCTRRNFERRWYSFIYR